MRRFDIWKLGEPDVGPVCTCKNPGCKARYKAFPRQSREYCALCQPPKRICSHGATDIETCLPCLEEFPNGMRMATVPIVAMDGKDRLPRK